MAVQEKLYTVQDLEKLPDDGKHYELDRGTLIKMPPTKREHGLVLAEILALIRNHTKAHDLGQVTGEIGYRLSENPDTVRAPDISFTSKARVTPFTGEYDRVAPDLAVETASPGNTADDMNLKVAQYFEAGVKQVWVFYPKTRTIHVYTSARSVAILGEGDTLDGGDVLPGFSVKVREIFSVLEHNE
jgi:Uma2 family endonuclease